MAGERLIYLKADPAKEAREKARLRARQAAREYASAMEEVEQVIGPDPRVAPAVEAAISEFCDRIVGRPSIRPA